MPQETVAVGDIALDYSVAAEHALAVYMRQGESATCPCQGRWVPAEHRLTAAQASSTSDLALLTRLPNGSIPTVTSPLNLPRLVASALAQRSPGAQYLMWKLVLDVVLPPGEAPAMGRSDPDPVPGSMPVVGKGFARRSALWVQQLLGSHVRGHMPVGGRSDMTLRDPEGEMGGFEQGVVTLPAGRLVMVAALSRMRHRFGGSPGWCI